MLFLELHSKSRSPVASNTRKSERLSAELLSVVVGSFRTIKLMGFPWQHSKEPGDFFMVTFFFSPSELSAHMWWPWEWLRQDVIGVAPTSVLLCVETSLSSCNLTRGNGFLVSSCCLSSVFFCSINFNTQKTFWPELFSIHIMSFDFLIVSKIFRGVWQ